MIFEITYEQNQPEIVYHTLNLLKANNKLIQLRQNNKDRHIQYIIKILHIIEDYCEYGGGDTDDDCDCSECEFHHNECQCESCKTNNSI